MAEAPEPSNILWENLHVTPRQQTCRKLLVSAAILVLLFGMFVLFTFLQLIAVKNANRYPASTDCTTVSAMFTDNATFEQYARIDEPYTVKQQGTGVYQCFCLNTFSYTQFFSYQEGVDTCYTYARQLVGGTLLSNTVAYSIVIANIIIREINIVMIKMSGNHTESGQIQEIFLAIFIATFFNTAILLLLTNANTQQTILSWLPFNGIYSDLTTDWFLQVGPTLISTMWINSVYVYIDFAIYVCTNCVYRFLDSGSCCFCKRSKTKCVTQQQYITLYSGPEHLMHFKYATILNTVFVTFMYGIPLPILYPIAAFTFFNLYIVEKFLVTYYYQKPPMYDDKLNNAAIKALKWAPIFMMFFGYWALGNQ